MINTQNLTKRMERSTPSIEELREFLLRRRKDYELAESGEDEDALKRSQHSYGLARHILSNIASNRMLTDYENRVLCLSHADDRSGPLFDHIWHCCSPEAPAFDLEGLAVYRLMPEEMYNAIMADDKERVASLYHDVKYKATQRYQTRAS